MKTLFLIIPFLLASVSCAGQSDTTAADSAGIARARNKRIYARARTASIMSAVLPGLGQVYNRKYWKVPLIYAGMGTFGYFFVTNNNDYNYYRRHLIADNDDDTSTLNTSGFDSFDLQRLKLQHRKTRDQAALAVVLIYIVNIIDANVDAHLRTFDVSDDLSLRVEPWQDLRRTEGGWRMTAGISLKLNYRQ